MSTSDRRVVVTGMGAVSAVGLGVEETWAGLIAGRSGVRTIDIFDPVRVTSKIAASVVDFDASVVLDRKEIRRSDRYTQLGLVGPARRWIRPACRVGWTALWPRRPGSSWAPAWAG
jgi:3-oxoacyl-[acyl-carrier-protein] synthase II